jgi:hypothetical protein
MEQYLKLVRENAEMKEREIKHVETIKQLKN